MFDLAFQISISNGLGVGFALLWILFGFRILFESWEIPDQPACVRRRAWFWWRAGLLGLVVTMAGPYNLENILRAQTLIDPLSSYLLQNLAHVTHSLSVCALITGFDISTGRRHWGFPFYILIPVLFGVAGSMM